MTRKLQLFIKYIKFLFYHTYQSYCPKWKWPFYCFSHYMQWWTFSGWTKEEEGFESSSPTVSVPVSDKCSAHNARSDHSFTRSQVRNSLTAYCCSLFLQLANRSGNMPDILQLFSFSLKHKCKKTLQFKQSVMATLPTSHAKITKLLLLLQHITIMSAFS